MATTDLLYPGASWNGTAGSGYAGSPPTDPTRTTAKPVLRWNEVPLQTFTGDFEVGVVAFAKGGIERVRFHCEGNTVDATSWSVNSRTGMWEYTCVLSHAAFSQSGDIHLYAEAVPTDATMQSRVIGPFRLRRDTSLYDAALTVTPSLSEVVGSRYQTIQNALTYCRTTSKARPLISITESGTYDIATQSSTFNGATGWATITTADGVAATLAKSGPSAATMRPGYDGVRLKGSGITLDLRFIGQFYADTNHSYWFDGITVMNSDPAGRDALVAGTPPISYWLRTLSSADEYRYYATDCTVEDAYNGLSYFLLVRNCTLNRIAADALQNNRFCYGVTLDDLNPGGLRNEINALTVQYSGAASSATVRKSGSNNSTSGTIVLAEGGADVLTVTLSAGKFPSDVKAEIEARAGWTATVLDNTRRAACLTKSGTSGLGAFSATDAKATSFTFVAAFDVHADLTQHFGTSGGDTSVSNRAVVNVIATGMSNTQSIFIDQTNTVTQDMAIVNVLADNSGATNPPLSQFASVESHVLLWHTTLVTQRLDLRTDMAGVSKYNPDGYCQNSLNALYGLAWVSTADADLVIDRNHFRTGSNPSGSMNASTGGSDSDLFVDPTGGDFTPKPGGPLVTNGGTALVPFDAAGNLRAATTSLGALAAVSERGFTENPSGGAVVRRTVAKVTDKPVGYGFDPVIKFQVNLRPVQNNVSFGPETNEKNVSVPTMIDLSNISEIAIPGVGGRLKHGDEVILQGREAIRVRQTYTTGVEGDYTSTPLVVVKRYGP